MLRRDSCVRRASVMTADRNMSATADRLNKICSDNMFCGSEACGNGSNPCVTYHVEIRLRKKRDRLNPARPKRIAAHTKKSRGIYIEVGIVLGEGGSGPNTQKATSTVPSISRADSSNRA